MKDNINELIVHQLHIYASKIGMDLIKLELSHTDESVTHSVTSILDALMELEDYVYAKLESKGVKLEIDEE